VYAQRQKRTRSRKRQASSPRARATSRKCFPVRAKGLGSIAHEIAGVNKAVTFTPLIEILPGSSHPSLQQPPLRAYNNIHFSHASHNFSTLPGQMPPFPRGRSVRFSPAVPVHPLIAGITSAAGRGTHGPWPINRFLASCVHN
jgi:hypothetical protein